MSNDFYNETSSLDWYIWYVASSQHPRSRVDILSWKESTKGKLGKNLESTLREPLKVLEVQLIFVKF